MEHGKIKGDYRAMILKIELPPKELPPQPKQELTPMQKFLNKKNHKTRAVIDLKEFGRYYKGEISLEECYEGFMTNNMATKEERRNITL